jgi:hypothetical protein
VLYVVLDCSDESCDASYEGWGEIEELEQVTCELCGCMLQAVAFAEAEEAQLPKRPDLQLRDAA